MYVFERLDPFHCTDKVFWYICTSYIKTFNTKPCSNILKRNLSTWGGGAKTVDNSICIISYDVIFIYKKHQGGIGMFFFLRWISKLHYKIHHNITKKYIWIMTGFILKKQLLVKFGCSRHPKRETVWWGGHFKPHPPKAILESHLICFMLVYYEINFKTSIN